MADSSITVAQAWEGIDFVQSDQDYKEDTATVSYIASGTNDELAAIAAVADFAPTEFKRTENDESPIPRKSVSVEERLTQTDWKISVAYQYASSSGGFDHTSTSTYSFDISTATKRVVFPISTHGRYPSSAKCKAGINDGEGTDAIMPTCRFSEKHDISNGVVTSAYIQKLNRMVGKVNNAAYKGYNAHEVLFLGANGTRTSGEKWEITFNFAFSENRSNLTVGTFTGISKRGWDVIWARYKETANDSNSEVLRTVKAVFVDQIYESADFSSLGI